MTAIPARCAPDVELVLQTFLRGLDVDHRRVAPGEWGLSPDCAGWPLHIGVALRGGLLCVQGEAVGAGRIDPSLLLHRNRLGVLVRFTQTRSGAVWVQAEIPLAAVDAAELDRVLGLVVEAAEWARQAAAGPSSSAPA